MSEHGRERFIDASNSVAEHAFFVSEPLGLAAQEERLMTMLNAQEVPKACHEEWLLDFYENRTRLSLFTNWQQAMQTLLSQLATSELLDYSVERPLGKFVYFDARDQDKKHCYTISMLGADDGFVDTIAHFGLQKPYIVDEHAFRQGIVDAYYGYNTKLLLTYADSRSYGAIQEPDSFWVGPDLFVDEQEYNLELSTPGELQPESSESPLAAVARAEHVVRRGQAALRSIDRSLFVYDTAHINTNDPLERLFRQ